MVTGLVERPGCVDLGALPASPNVMVADVLDQVGLATGATHATVVSADGGYTASIPLEELLAGGHLAVGEDIRLTITGGRTLCWNVKDVATIRVTDGPEPDSVPENPPH